MRAGEGQPRRRRPPLHKRCVAIMIDWLLAEGTVSGDGTCDDCHDWAVKVQDRWYAERYK